MRADVLRLVEAFPGVSISRVSRFLGGDAAPYLERLKAEGLVRIQTAPAARRGRPPACVWPAIDRPKAVEVTPDLEGEHARTVAAVTRWVVDLGAMRDARGASDAVKRGAELALAMLATIYRAPHRYAREVPLASVANADGRTMMRAARLLQERGAIDLFERKGAGRVTTIQLQTVPPYPLS
jgi:hypothetical protein